MTEAEERFIPANRASAAAAAAALVEAVWTPSGTEEEEAASASGPAVICPRRQAMPTSHSPHVREVVEADDEEEDAEAEVPPPPEDGAPMLDEPRGMARPLFGWST